MQNQLGSMWDQIKIFVDECPLLSMLIYETSLSDIDYKRYMQYGYSLSDVNAGFELIQIYRTLNNYIDTE